MVHVEQPIQFDSASYSAFSGIIVSVSVGTPPQRIRVALDLSSKNSYLYSSSGCPLFVDPCFNPTDSVTFQGGVTDFGESSDRVGIDDSTSFSDFRFRLVKSIFASPNDVREAAGVIGIGRRSEIAHKRLFRFSDTLSRGLLVGEVYRSQILTDGVGFSWEFDAEIRIGGIQVAHPVRYSPGEPDLLLPLSARGRLEALGGRVDSDGRMLFDCGSFMGTAILRLAPFSDADDYFLGITGRPTSVTGTECYTGVRFVRNLVQGAVIGRIFTRLFWILIIIGFIFHRGIEFQPRQPR